MDCRIDGKRFTPGIQLVNGPVPVALTPQEHFRLGSVAIFPLRLTFGIVDFEFHSGHYFLRLYIFKCLSISRVIRLQSAMISAGVSALSIDLWLVQD